MRTCADTKPPSLTPRPFAMPRPPIHHGEGENPASIDPMRRNMRSSRAAENRGNGDNEFAEEVDVESDEYTRANASPVYSELRRELAAMTREEGLLPKKSTHSYSGIIPEGIRPEPKGNMLCYVLFGVVALIVSIGSVQLLSGSSNNENLADKKQWLRDKWANNIQIVRDKFPSQKKDIWSDFYSGIQKVLLEEPTEPTVFLLVHRGTETTSSCLARKVGEIAHNYINATSPHPLILDGRALRGDEAMIEDYGLLVETYRPLVEEHRIMILDNLQLVPATIARGLHSFCDTVTPLVRKAVYIFTLNVDNGGNVEGSPTRVAERELNSVWKQLDRDILSPLITRITGGSVFRIEPEEGMRNVC